MNRLIVMAGSIFIASASVVNMVNAKQAEPMAADPLTEERVNDIASELRCLVCQNQTIADSNAELAVDLKNQVRDMVGEGRSDTEIMEYMVQRYGDFVRYRPPVKGATVILWAGPFLFLLLGLVILVITLRKRNAVLSDDAPISAEQSRHLKSVLDDNQQNNNEGGDARS